ncbi:hypothetical protein RYX36_033130 [Vicia faba]
MEHSEIDFDAALPIAQEPRKGSKDRSPPPSNLNHTVDKDDDTLAVELHEKLDFNFNDEEGGAESETEVKVSELNVGVESVKDENEESVEDVVSVKGEERVDGDRKGWETNSWNENVNEELGGGRDGGSYDGVLDTMEFCTSKPSLFLCFLIDKQVSSSCHVHELASGALHLVPPRKKLLAVLERVLIVFDRNIFCTIGRFVKA